MILVNLEILVILAILRNQVILWFLVILIELVILIILVNYLILMDFAIRVILVMFRNLLILVICFLDTQVSLAPTHVSKLVSWLVTLSDFQSLVSNGRSNKKSSKNKVHLLSNFASGRTLPTHDNVYEGLNALKCI